MKFVPRRPSNISVAGVFFYVLAKLQIYFRTDCFAGKLRAAAAWLTEFLNNVIIFLSDGRTDQTTLHQSRPEREVEEVS